VKRQLILGTVGIVVLLLLGASPADATGPHGGKPSITIISPRNGSIVHGHAVTVRVSVANFKLVQPVYLNPPALPGNQGHIHYYVDSLANFVATRDAATSLSHTFTDLRPGPHTFIAYLATSQHAQFPGVAPVKVHVTVAPAGHAAHAGAKPSIAIMGIQSQTTRSVTDVVAHVAVSHFKLVPPVYVNPPLLHGYQGHIHYVLDGLKNFQATRDAVTALSHPWRNVTPGYHTIIAYLATSQHQRFPTIPVAQVRIFVAPAQGHRHASIRIVPQLPKTGGGAEGGGDSHGRWPTVVLALLATLIGFIVLTAGRSVSSATR
jgi:hypothetical protein